MATTVRKVCLGVRRFIVLGVVVLSLGGLMLLGLGPRTGRYQVATVLSASMRPTVAEGSMVLITPMAARDVRVGDIVTYQIPVEDRRVVTHRVVEILEAGDHPVIRTQGDANNAPDPWTARMDAGPLWKVRADVPKLGSAVTALRQPVAQRMSVLVLPLVMCVIWLRDIWLPRRTEPPAVASAPTPPAPGTIAA